MHYSAHINRNATWCVAEVTKYEEILMIPSRAALEDVLEYIRDVFEGDIAKCQDSLLETLIFYVLRYVQQNSSRIMI